MADEKKYKITRGNYTIKRTHKSLSDAVIYERDYMVTTNLGGFNGNSFPYEENGFKMVHANNATIGRKHTYGKYEEPVTLKDLNNDGTEESSESRLELSGRHTSVLDFVYYGNCADFLRASIENIILNFPGELYFTGKKALTKSGETWYYVENPFNINIWDIAAPKETDINELRYFALKGQNYIFFDGNDGNMGCMGEGWQWSSTPVDNFKFCNGRYSHEIIITIPNIRIEIRRYYLKGKFVLLHKTDKAIGSYIRPSQNYIDASFERLEEFEKTLMNRGTTPLYTAVLDFPYETEHGIETYRRMFTWPLSIYESFTIVGKKPTEPIDDGDFKGQTYIIEGESGTTTATWTGDSWEINSKRSKYSHYYNIDISEERYKNYIKGLLALCTFYDENFTDNLWRNLTHDAIKNLDNTFIHEVSDVDEKEIKENVEKVHKFLNACARQFDEIKRYADGIKNVNKITYDGDTNIPDYFLTDVLNLSGWEISNSLESLDVSKKEVSGLFSGEMNRTYNSNDVNVLFLKNLKLNSREILSRKGTKCGIEMILGLFGLKSKDFVSVDGSGDDWDYAINEYVSIVEPKEELATSATSLAVEEFGLMRESYAETVGEGYDPEPTDGLPVKIIEFEKGNIKYRCMVPWFKEKSRNNMPYKYDGSIYFQMYGGWELNDVELNNGTTATTYCETMNYLGVVEKTEDLIYVPVSELHGDDIFFVANEGTEGTYYKLNNIEYSQVISDNGWQEVSSADTETNERIRQMEAIIDTENGNNPHTGFGHYDSGAKFYEYLKQIFKDSIENCSFIDEAFICNCSGSCSGECLNSGITNCGFEIKQVRDNVKCWYFAAEESKPKNAENGYAGNGFEGIYDYDYNFEDSGYTENNPWDFKNEARVTTALTEYSSDSIINDKNMEIIFKVPEIIASNGGAQEYMKYIISGVMPYVRQMIPSTTIYRITFGIIE